MTREPRLGRCPVTLPARRRGPSRRGRLRITLRTAELHAPKGHSTLGTDPARFQTKPPACYRASWQLPGRDSHPLATTSLCWISYSISNLQTLGADCRALTCDRASVGYS